MALILIIVKGDKYSMVSVIIPMYNTVKYIQKCVDSVLNCNFSDMEIVIVDDGSKDGSGELCRKLYGNRDNVILIEQENHGVSHARNVGMEAASGEWIAFVDSDDYVAPEFISSMVSVAEKNPRSLVACKWIEKNLDGTLRACSATNGGVQYFFDEERFLAVLDNNVLCGYSWNKLFNNKIIKEGNLKFDTSIKITEDLLFCIEYINHVDSIICINTPLYYYINNYNSSSRSLKFEKENWLSEIKSRKICMKMIPQEYRNATRECYKFLFFSLIHYWIKMYKSGKFELPDKSTKKELRHLKSIVNVKSFRFKLYYYGELMCPRLLFFVIYIGMALRKIMGSEYKKCVRN